MSDLMEMPVMVSEGAASVQGAPFFKLWDLGDTFAGALGSDPAAAEARRPVRATTQVDGKTVPKSDADGNPVFELKADGKTVKQEEVLHFAAVAGSTAKVGTKGSAEVAAVTPLEHYRYSVSGWLWGRIIEARKSLPAVVNAAGQTIVGAGQASCQDIYIFKVTHKTASVDNGAEEAQLAAAGLKIEKDGTYTRVVLPDKEAELRRLEVRLNLGLETRAARKEIGVVVRRANATSANEVAAVQAAFKMWQDKVWLQGRSDAHVEDDAPVAPVAPVAAVEMPAAAPAPVAAPAAPAADPFGLEPF